VDVIKVEHESDTELNQTSSHSGFHFIKIKQEQEADGEDEVSEYPLNSCQDSTLLNKKPFQWTKY
jgi:hypothetical protein